MKNHGFVPCSEDEAEQSYVFAFGEGWVTLVNKDYKDDRLKAGDDAMNMSAALKTSAFMMDVIDSDFAYIHLSERRQGWGCCRGHLGIWR